MLLWQPVSLLIHVIVLQILSYKEREKEEEREREREKESRRGIPFHVNFSPPLPQQLHIELQAPFYLSKGCIEMAEAGVFVCGVGVGGLIYSV